MGNNSHTYNRFTGLSVADVTRSGDTQYTTELNNQRLKKLHERMLQTQELYAWATNEIDKRRLVAEMKYLQFELDLPIDKFTAEQIFKLRRIKQDEIFNLKKDVHLPPPSTPKPKPYQPPKEDPPSKPNLPPPKAQKLDEDWHHAPDIFKKKGDFCPTELVPDLQIGSRWFYFEDYLG